MSENGFNRFDKRQFCSCSTSIQSAYFSLSKFINVFFLGISWEFVIKFKLKSYISQIVWRDQIDLKLWHSVCLISVLNKILHTYQFQAPSNLRNRRNCETCSIIFVAQSLVEAVMIWQRPNRIDKDKLSIKTTHKRRGTQQILQIS